MREVLFATGTFRPRIEHIRRVGKPRANQLIETYKGAHIIIDHVTPFDMNHIQQIQTLHGFQRSAEKLRSSNISTNSSANFAWNKSNHQVPVCTCFIYFTFLLHD